MSKAENKYAEPHWRSTNSPAAARGRRLPLQTEMDVLKALHKVPERRKATSQGEEAQVVTLSDQVTSVPPKGRGTAVQDDFSERITLVSETMLTNPFVTTFQVQWT
jgi:hypothetical protein